MFETVKDAPTAPQSALSDERKGPMLFAPNDALHKLLRAGSACRFDDLRSSLREATARRGPNRTQVQHGSLTPAAARLRAATRYHEQHVLAWYALGRVTEARSAREAILHYRQAPTPETQHTANSRTGQRTTATPSHPHNEGRLLHN
jgi:hypothetical protein